MREREKEKKISHRFKSNANLSLHLESCPESWYHPCLMCPLYAVIFFQASNLIKIPFASPQCAYPRHGMGKLRRRCRWEIVCFIRSRRHHVFLSLLLSITEGNSISCRILCSKLSVELTTMICLIDGLEPNLLFRTHHYSHWMWIRGIFIKYL